MKPNDLPGPAADPSAAHTADTDADLLAPLLRAPVAASPAAWPVPTAPVVGELLALADGAVPLVRHPAQADTCALRARSTVDLHGAHIGCQVLLLFEQGDPQRPIVIGVLQGQPGWPLPQPPAQVQVEADGARLVVSARDQLVLRCGKASITLTQAGKVLIEGSYLSSRSSGVNRIKGGSVQLN